MRAIVRRNELQQMVDDLQKKIDSLHAEAELTLQCGSHAQHAQLLKEKQGYEISFQVIQASLEKAALLVEAIKRDIQRDQDDILRRRK